MRILVSLIRQFRTWDRPSKAALVIALLLLVTVLLTVAFGFEDIRQPALIGAAGLLLAIQLISLWGNRGLVTPFTQAQRHYMNGDFEGARDVLETLRAEGKGDSRSLTLLGNTYRQLGRLDESESVLYEALNIQREQFPLYGFGRTLLAQGRYAEAAQAMEEALALGAPPIAAYDIGEAYFRQHNHDAAREWLIRAKPLAQENYRILMLDYMLSQLDGTNEPLPPREVLQSGLPYWRASAERFKHTRYGQALVEDLQHLETLIGE
jgi:tetratricopeptide (TPR) repeat protein